MRLRPLLVPLLRLLPLAPLLLLLRLVPLLRLPPLLRLLWPAATPQAVPKEAVP